MLTTDSRSAERTLGSGLLRVGEIACCNGVRPDQHELAGPNQRRRDRYGAPGSAILEISFASTLVQDRPPEVLSLARIECAAQPHCPYFRQEQRVRYRQE